MVCAVVECKNGSKQKKLRGSDLLFHRFPKSPHLRKVWVSKCKRLEAFDPKHSVICSDHFVPEDYQRDLKNELLQLPIVKRLKPSAVPSVFPGRIIDEKEKKKEAAAFNRKKRNEKRENSRIVRDILKEFEKNGNEQSTTIEEADQEDLKPSIQEINSNQVYECCHNNNDDQDVANAEQATPECDEISEYQDQVKTEADGDMNDLSYELAASTEKPNVVDIDECSNCQALKKRNIELELRKKLSDHMVCYQMKELERLNTILRKAREKIKNLEAQLAK